MNNQVRYVSNLRTRTDDDEREKSLYRFDEVAAAQLFQLLNEVSGGIAPCPPPSSIFARHLSGTSRNWSWAAAMGRPRKKNWRADLDSMPACFPNSIPPPLTHSLGLPTFPSLLPSPLLCTLQSASAPLSSAPASSAASPSSVPPHWALSIARRGGEGRGRRRTCALCASCASYRAVSWDWLRTVSKLATFFGMVTGMTLRPM